MPSRDEPATTSSRIGRPRDESRHQAILDAAIELVAEVGYDRMSMDAVAARARASKATIYRRWPGKAELVVEAVHCCVEQDAADLLPDRGSLRADLLALLEHIRTGLEGTNGDLMFGLALAARSDPELGRVLREQLFEDKDRVAARIVERAVARREVGAGLRHGPALVDELAPAAMIVRQLCGQPLDDAFLDHVTDDILLPLLTRPTPTASSPPLERQR
ncbi:MAG: TetR/AcrR family transcriptional regulator [Actinomycetota bacterium]|nr:TetR/AcrR family transcriptional regulator [Actinomycetota bacterium]